MTTAIAVSGATGRLGKVIAELIEAHDEFTLHAALNSASDPDQMRGADVLIDVTEISVSERLVAHALGLGMNVVVGTSGWNSQRLEQLEASIPEEQGVLVVPNFSVGSVLGTHLATIAARFFDSIEIIEAHHNRKVDSPSGTAVRTAEAIAAARTGVSEAPFVDQAARGELIAGIPVHSLRLRGVVADQRTIFGGNGEVLTVHHETLSNHAYEQGIALALHQAPKLRGLTVGLADLLELS